MTFGEYVRDRRLRLGMTQDELADRIGNRAKNWVSQLETGKVVQLPDPDTVSRIARALAVDEMALVQAAGYLQEQSADEEEISVYTFYDDIERLALPPRVKRILREQAETLIRLSGDDEETV